MAVQRERFAPAQRPIIADPEPTDPAPLVREEWHRRKREAHVWQRGRREQLRRDATASGQARADELNAQARRRHQADQSDADEWWRSLVAGDQSVLRTVLDSAFADNPAPVVVTQAAGSQAALTLILPGLDVLPEKKAHVTPTGRLSSKAWTKTELHEVYAELLGAHLLATIRETWAVAPSLTSLRIAGVRRTTEAQELLFEVSASRNAGRWDDDRFGMTVLANAARGLNRAGKAREVKSWPTW